MQKEQVKKNVRGYTKNDIDPQDTILSPSTLQALVDREIQEGNATKIGFYYRDLQDGPWYGINYDEKFFPASLVKVPLLIAYLKKSETDTNLLTAMLPPDEDEDKNQQQYFTPKHPIDITKAYSVNDLLTHMIVDSDNNAYIRLYRNIDKKSFTDIFSLLDLPLPQDPADNLQLYSPRDQARFYRILYNASFLNRTNSQKALDLLTKTAFTDGLASEIPHTIPVAHKFGTYINGAQYELHDCGIVYYPKSPYILCIMTLGDDMPRLEHTIGDISREIYHEVETQQNQHKNQNKSK